MANPWGRNPIELVSALVAISEMLGPQRELRYAIGSGVTHARWVDRPKPLRAVRETMVILRALLAGECVTFDRFPVLRDYFHLHGQAELSVSPARRDAVSLWFALTGGPLGDALAAEVADGVVIDAGTVMGIGPLTDGRSADYAASIDHRREAIGRLPPLRRILNLCMSLSDDRRSALD